MAEPSKNEKITPEESHKLATAPLPDFNIISGKIHAGNNIHNNDNGFEVPDQIILR